VSSFTQVLRPAHGEPQRKVIISPDSKPVAPGHANLDLADRQPAVVFLKQKVSVVLVTERSGLGERLPGRSGLEGMFGPIGVSAKISGVGGHGGLREGTALLGDRDGAAGAPDLLDRERGHPGAILRQVADSHSRAATVGRAGG
jgi:hypothetical protein